ncbi:DUF1214 domain-containing protein [Sediminitomix flava]|uniref:Uncharacterized protein DUF1214 n=1 Tax=Sediminitomix flava TaxID=379075 RepID=A0A316A4Y0_SEDFL|nr:DUF1214 domain-containing protein [Sediminitomix flava]PWJ44817.1 uncharacterized protein DUF1214 [Sediminitomix flava]
MKLRPIVLILFVLSVACKSQKKNTNEQQVLEQAWNTFYQTISEIEDKYLATKVYEMDSVHKAGAYELLQTQIAAQLSGAVSGGDGSYPHFRNLLDPGKRIGIDNPDTYYRAANISNFDGKTVYRIYGNRGNTADFLLEIFFPENPKGAISVMDDEEITFDENGNFEVYISANKTGENWIEFPKSDKVYMIISRHSHANWEKELSGNIYIERLGTEGKPSKNSSPTVLAKRITAAANILKYQGEFWPSFQRKIKLIGKNKAIAFKPTGEIGILTQYNSVGSFELENNDALVIKIPEIDAEYCGFQLTDFWAASPDWPNRQCSLSWGRNGKAQAYKSKDGYYYFVISKEDPQIQNWLDPCGMTAGVFVIRLQSVKQKDVKKIKPETTLVKLSELDTVLPRDIPSFNAEQRKKQISIRQEHVKRRYQTW